MTTTGQPPPDERECEAAALGRLRETLRSPQPQPVGPSAMPESPAGADEAAPAGERAASAEQPAGDPLPEHTAYHDRGCHVSPSCLRCPLPVCIFDRQVNPGQQQRRSRDRSLRLLASSGWSTDRLSRRFRLSPSQVRRIRGGTR